MKVRLSSWQTEVWNSKSRYKVVNAGRRTGKSFLTALKMVEFAVKNEGMDVWYVAPNYKQAKLIMWEMLKDLVPHQAIIKKNDTELIIYLKNKSRISLKGAEDPDKLRGVKIDLCIFDECAFITRWAEVWKVMRPTLADSQADVWFISTPDGFNHFKDLCDRASVTDGWQYFHFTTYDNPFIAKEEIDSMKGEMGEAAFAQEVLGKFTKKSGLVYPEFSRGVHVKELEDFEPVFYLRGCDRGFRNPTAVVVIAVNKDDVWYQVDELYEPGLTNPVLHKKIDELCGNKVFELSTMDSAQAGDIQELNDLGHDWIAVKKQSGESNKSYVRWKIQKFSDRLRVGENGKPGYYVHPKCQFTIEEFERYSWPDDDPDKPPEENPIKMFDHTQDATADLNSFYMHWYKPVNKKPWDDKVPGTYIRPSPVKDNEDEENDWGREVEYDYD